MVHFLFSLRGEGSITPPHLVIRSERHWTSGLALHERFHLPHEQCHRGQQLIEVVAAVKIDLKGFQTGLVPKAPHVLGHLRWGPLADRPFRPRGGRSWHGSRGGG